MFTEEVEVDSTEREASEPSVSTAKNNNSSDSEDNQPPEKKAKKVIIRSFQQKWFNDYDWLEYDSEKKLMYCKLCKKCKKDTAFTTGCSNFRTSTLVRHVNCKDHRNSVVESNAQDSMTTVMEKAFNEEEESILTAMKTTYFMAKEDIAIHKYPSFLNFLQFLGNEPAKHFEGSTYHSRQISGEMQDAIAKVITEKLGCDLQNSQFITVMCDESTDTTVLKKLCIYLRYMRNYEPVTSFVENVQIDSGTADAIYDKIKACLKKYKVGDRQVIGFGSDGASVMTGSKAGVAAHMKKHVNSYIEGVHCIAHRLALVMSQAAEKKNVPYLAKYQEILTAVYKYFKHSAKRVSALAEMQKVLDMPEIHIKEVYAVRWFAFYNALEAVFRNWEPLMIMLEQSKQQTELSGKGQGLHKLMGTYEFLATMHLLMDVIPILTHLNLIFQKSNLDIAVIVPAIKSAVQDIVFKGKEWSLLIWIPSRCG